MTTTVHLCRRILRELKEAAPEGHGGTTWRYICSRVRESKSAGQDSTEDIRILKAYLHYIESCGAHKALLELYQGKGERSIAQAANMVGLALPRNPF